MQFAFLGLRAVHQQDGLFFMTYSRMYALRLHANISDNLGWEKHFVRDQK